MTADSVRHIGTDRQLFVDAFWISVANGVSRKLHAPRKRETVLERDKPWEHDHVSYMGTMKDGDTLRAYYRCGRFASTEKDPEITAYQESVDGIHWQKPNLSILEYEGSKDNNIVWLGPGANMAPFRDDNPDVPADERYKAVVRTRDLWALASADGLHWRLLQKDPISTDGPFDSFNVSFWDPWREEYVAYTRGKAGTEGSFIGPNGGKGGVRWIRRTTSKDFRNWSPPEDIDAGDTPFEHLYTNSCVAYERAPGTYLMFPSRFVPERKPKPDWPGGSGVSDIVFMSSRDGIHFDRSFMEAFIRPGPDQDNWHERGLYLDRIDRDLTHGTVDVRQRALAAANRPHRPLHISHGWLRVPPCRLLRGRGSDPSVRFRGPAARAQLLDLGRGFREGGNPRRQWQCHAGIQPG